MKAKKLIFYLMMVLILAYVSWLVYIHINSQSMKEIISEITEGREIDRIDVSSIYAEEVSFSIKDKDDIEDILKIMDNMEVVNTEYTTIRQVKKLDKNLSFCSGKTEVMIDNYTYPSITIRALNCKSALRPKHSEFQVIDFKEEDMGNLEEVLNKYRDE